MLFSLRFIVFYMILIMMRWAIGRRLGRSDTTSTKKTGVKQRQRNVSSCEATIYPSFPNPRIPSTDRLLTIRWSVSSFPNFSHTKWFCGVIIPFFVYIFKHIFTHKYLHWDHGILVRNICLYFATSVNFVVSMYLILYIIQNKYNIYFWMISI